MAGKDEKYNENLGFLKNLKLDTLLPDLINTIHKATQGLDKTIEMNGPSLDEDIIYELIKALDKKVEAYAFADAIVTALKDRNPSLKTDEDKRQEKFKEYKEKQTDYSALLGIVQGIINREGLDSNEVDKAIRRIGGSFTKELRMFVREARREAKIEEKDKLDQNHQKTRNKSDLNLATDAEKQIISTVRETITHYHNMGRSVQDTDKALEDYRSQLIRQQDIATFDAVVTQEKANFAQKLYEEWKREADKRTSQSAQQSQDSRINSPVIESLHKQYEVVRGYEDIIKTSKALGLTLDETEAKLLQHYAGLSSTDQAIFRDIDKDKDLEPKKTASEDYENSIAFAKEVTKAVSELKSLIKLNGMGVLSSPAVVEQATLNPAYGAAIGRIQEEQISDEKKANDPVAKALADVNAKKELRSKLKTITDEHGLNSTVATDFAKNLPGGEEELLRQRAAAQAAATGPISVMLGKNSQLSTFYGIKSSIGHKADTYEQISKHGFTEEGGIGSGARSKAGSIIAKVGGVIGNEKLENKGEEMASTSKGLSRAGLAGLVIMLKEGVQGGLKVVGDALSAPFKVFEGMKSLRGLENIDELMKDVMKVITSTIGAITGVISGMMDGISKGISSGIEGMANILTAILNVITTVMNLIIDSSPLLQGMLKLFMKMVNLILMPIGNIIAMLILPVLRRNLPKIVELTQKGAKIMQEVMNGDSSSLKSFLSEIGKTLGVFIGEIVATLSPAISTVFTEVFPSLVSAITTPVDVQRQKTSGESLLYKNRDGETIGINQKTLSALSTELKASWLEGLTPIMETISKSPFDYMVDAIVTAVTDERVKAAFAQIFKSALGGAQGVVDEVKDSMTFGKDINTAIGYGMDLAMMAGPLALVGIYDLGKKLHLWADGGVATKATPGIFGEAGPEAIIPLSELPSMVSQINERGDGAMVRNGGITFIFNGDIYGMEDFEAKVRGVATAMNSEYRFR